MRKRRKPEKAIPSYASFHEVYTCCRVGGCKTCEGIYYAHGPYWYASWREQLGPDGKPVKAENRPGRPGADDDVVPQGSPGRQRTAYVGKDLDPWMIQKLKKQKQRRR